MTRTDKIKLLASLVNGSIKVEDIMEKKLLIKVDIDNTKFYINNKEVANNVFVEELKKDPGYHNQTMKFNVITENLSNDY